MVYTRTIYITRVFSDSEVRVEVIKKDDLIRKAGDLRVLPFVARKVLETLNDENCSIDDLSDIIENDQTLAARVLKISNSALYGLRHEVTGLRQAILLLGFKTIRSLVLSVSTRALYKKFGMTEKIIWEHSVGAAIAAKMIAGGLGSSELGEAAFVGGLMHDIGKVVLNNETPDVFAEVMMKIYNDGVDSIVAEEEVYGYNHVEIGAGVVGKWGFSPLLVKIIENHHRTDYKTDDIKEPLTLSSIACVNLADHVCKALGIGYRNRDETLVLHELPSAVFLKVPAGKLETLVKDINDTYTKEKSIFD
ncbi:MAG: HDOD domain-containing protein [Nitrospiraceae bacterium]|nr:MAG: HDOD domain-containing protein [Nitrospiraceae bacterium]